MELTKDDVELISTHLEAAVASGFSKMVFHNHHAYGISDNHSACMISMCELSVPKSVSIGIPALADFNKRFSTYGDAASVSLELKSDHKTKSVIFKTGRSKMTYRCADHTKIQYPKGVDDPTIGQFTIAKEEATELKKAISIMSSPQYVHVTISSRGETKLHFYDSTNDEFELFLHKRFTSDDPDAKLTYNQKFDCRGPFINVMQQVLKESEGATYMITESGNLKVIFKDLVEVYLIPSITSED
jgi:hypothetical protein